MKPVGLIGPTDRKELVRLAIRLEERGGEGIILDSQRDPAFRIDGDEAWACGENLARFNAIYVADLGIRSPWASNADGTCDLDKSEAALSASRRHLTAWNTLLDHLAPRVKIVNPPRTHDLHALKPNEIAAYHAEGLPTPLTVATSDASALMELPATPRWGWVAKGMVGGYGYTESFDPPGELEQARRCLSGGPLMVQERIEGDNVRAFVLDGQNIGAAEVAAGERDSTDSRRGDTRLRRIEVPPEATRSAVDVAAHWGMTFCAVDFMRDAETGRFWLLECNSAPFFVNFEIRSGCDITTPLARYLLEPGAETAARR